MQVQEWVAMQRPLTEGVTKLQRKTLEEIDKTTDVRTNLQTSGL